VIFLKRDAVASFIRRNAKFAAKYHSQKHTCRLITSYICHEDVAAREERANLTSPLATRLRTILVRKNGFSFFASSRSSSPLRCLRLVRNFIVTRSHLSASSQPDARPRLAARAFGADSMNLTRMSAASMTLDVDHGGNGRNAIIPTRSKVQASLQPFPSLETRASFSPSPLPRLLTR